MGGLTKTMRFSFPELFFVYTAVKPLFLSVIVFISSLIINLNPESGAIMSSFFERLIESAVISCSSFFS